MPNSSSLIYPVPCDQIWINYTAMLKFWGAPEFRQKEECKRSLTYILHKNMMRKVLTCVWLMAPEKHIHTKLSYFLCDCLIQQH
jgi:hypothetical protein